MSVTNITNDNYKKEVLESDKMVLVDFYAAWCGPCRAMTPIVEELASEQNDVKICKINIDEQRQLAKEYGIMSIPTLVLINNGKVVNTKVGLAPKAEIIKLIKNHS